MDDADIFHTAVAGYGGRLDSESVHPQYVARLEVIARRARGFLQTAATALPDLPPIYFDFIDTWKFNAIAFESDGRYFIGVTRGALATLGVLFDRMLADPQFLPSIGDPNEEVADLPLLPHLGIDFERSLDSVPQFPQPQSPARRWTAGRLGELAFDFLIAHEFGHIANGHLNYLLANRGSLVIDERSGVSWASSDAESALISQTMEMDADGVAAQLSLSSEWRKVTGSLGRPPAREWDDYYSRPDMVTLHWSWAVSSLFRLFGEARLTDGEVSLESHPRPRLRSVMAQRAIQGVPKPEGLDTHPAFLGVESDRFPVIRAGQRDVERIFAQMTGQPEATEGLDEAWGDVGRSQMYRLQDYWQTKLKEELLEFAYHPLISYGDSGEEATGEGS